MNTWMIYTAVLFLSVCAGCDMGSMAAKANKAVNKDKQEKPAVKFVDNLELAKVLLRPERKAIAIERDPFKPILTKEMGFLGQTSGGAAGALSDPQVEIVGFIEMEEEKRICLRVKNKADVYRLNDKIGNYIITQIANDQVTLKSPLKTIVKKRGKK